MRKMALSDIIGCMATAVTTSIRRPHTAPRLTNLEPAAARALLKLNLADAEIRRIDQLMARAVKSKLTPAQESELDFLLNFGDILSFLHSKARQALKQFVRNGRRKSA
jgi:hypothetical protein